MISEHEDGSTHDCTGHIVQRKQGLRRDSYMIQLTSEYGKPMSKLLTVPNPGWGIVQVAKYPLPQQPNLPTTTGGPSRDAENQDKQVTAHEPAPAQRQRSESPETPFL